MYLVDMAFSMQAWAVHHKGTKCRVIVLHAKEAENVQLCCHQYLAYIIIWVALYSWVCTFAASD